MIFLMDDHLPEDGVLLSFRLCHQRWTTSHLSLMLRFNGGDPSSLSHVKVHQNFQLNHPQHRVDMPCIPSREPLACASTSIQYDGGPRRFVDATLLSLCCQQMTDRCLASKTIFDINYKCLIRLYFFNFVFSRTFDPCSTISYREMLYSEV